MDRPADLNAVIDLMAKARQLLEQRPARTLGMELHEDLAKALGSLREAIERHDPTITRDREAQRAQAQTSREKMLAIIAVAEGDDEEQRREARRRQEELRQRQQPRLADTLAVLRTC